MTLLQCISEFIENISVTDRQEESIQCSLSNLESHLNNVENGLSVNKTFPNGSYERDTIIRPLNDVDLFCVLYREDWEDDYGNLPSPQNVLTNLKKFLNDVPEYKGKVSQDRPCITIELSDKDFDVLPCFECFGGGYLIPNYDLKTWTYSYPEQLTSDLNSIHRERCYKVKPTIKAIKHFNKENSKLIPSYHIEETAIQIFQMNDFKNYETSIRLWFDNAEYYLLSNKFKFLDDYTYAIDKIKKTKKKLNEAKDLFDKKDEDEAIQLWYEIFGNEFPSVDLEEAKNFSKSLADGTLKISTAGTLSLTTGNSIKASKGFFGDVL